MSGQPTLETRSAPPGKAGSEVGTRVLGCWCGASRDRELFRTPKFGVLRCRACGCCRIDPPPIASDVESAGFYSDYYGHGGEDSSLPPRKPARSFRFWRVTASVPALAAPGGSVADIGCGEGGLCGELVAAGWRKVLGVDVSKTRIAKARKRHPRVEFFDRPLAECGIEPSSLDLVILDNVLEHLPRPVETLLEVRRLLKPSGRLAAITPNMESGHFRLLGRRWTPELAPHAHIYLFTPKSLDRLLAMCGLRRIAGGSFHLPRAPLAALLAPLARGAWRETVWRAAQEAGGGYGRLVGAGPMVYVVAGKA